jgi:hypothetical protein
MDTKTLANRRTRRTTLTLEADVADYIEEKLAADRRLKEKQLINGLIRKGITVETGVQRKRFHIKPFKTKLKPGITARKLEELLDEF